MLKWRGLSAAATTPINDQQFRHSAFSIQHSTFSIFSVSFQLYLSDLESQRPVVA